MTTPSEYEGVPVSRLIDLRHELTALIKKNLYGGLKARRASGSVRAQSFR